MEIYIYIFIPNLERTKICRWRKRGRMRKSWWKRRHEEEEEGRVDG